MTGERKPGPNGKDLSYNGLLKKKITLWLQLVTHARHPSTEKCKSIGLNVKMMEDDKAIQDAILTVHHALIHMLSASSAYQIIENHNGVAFIQSAAVLVQGQGIGQGQGALDIPTGFSAN